MRFGLFLVAALLAAGPVPDTPEPLESELELARQEAEPLEPLDFELHLALAPLEFEDEEGHPLPADELAPTLPLLPAPRPWQPRTA
jgi:hypothetical protein